jgi:hypothetical protein
MSLLRTLKKLVLGETWILPCGVAVLLAASAVVRTLGGWPSFGGPLLLGGVIAVLLVSVARTARGARRT